MTEQFISHELARKLKEIGFTCNHPFAMYNENGIFCPLFTSADKNESIKCIFGNREYYDYDDFDEYDFIAPTAEQVLTWLRDTKNIFIEVYPIWVSTSGHPFAKEEIKWCYECFDLKEPFYKDTDYGTDSVLKHYAYNFDNIQDSAEQAALCGIQYIVEDLIRTNNQP